LNEVQSSAFGPHPPVPPGDEVSHRRDVSTRER
jgi:hypothetical protein